MLVKPAESNAPCEVIDRAARGEQITSRARALPLPSFARYHPPPLSAQLLLERWRRLPRLDPDGLRADIDATLEAGL